MVILFVVSIEIIHNLEGHVIVSSIETMSLSIRNLEDHYVDQLKHYLHFYKDIHASWKVMHRGESYIPGRYLCLAENAGTARRYSCIAKNHASRVDIHASRVDNDLLRRYTSIVTIYSCIVGIYSCPYENQASWKDIHALKKVIPPRKLGITGRYDIHASQKNYASWEDIYASRKIMPHEKYSCIAEHRA